MKGNVVSLLSLCIHPSIDISSHCLYASIIPSILYILHMCMLP